MPWFSNFRWLIVPAVCALFLVSLNCWAATPGPDPVRTRIEFRPVADGTSEPGPADRLELQPAAESGPGFDVPSQTVGRVVPPTEVQRFALQNGGLRNGESSTANRQLVPLLAAGRPHSNNPGDLVYSSTGPSVRLDARGPNKVIAGEPATYTLSLQNRGATAARGVFVRIAVPHSVKVADAEPSAGEIQHREGSETQRHLVWMFDRLPGQAAETLELDIRSNSDDEVRLDVEWTFLPLAESLQIVTLRPELQIVVQGPGEVVQGDNPRFSVCVSNPGTGAAKDVVVDVATDQEPVKTVPLGSLSPGEQQSFQVEFGELAHGSNHLVAVANAAHGLRHEVTHALQVQYAQLEMIALGPPHRMAGGRAVYELEVSSTGSTAARNVAATVCLPPGARAVELPAGARQSADQVSWRLGNLVPGEVRDFTVECELATPGNHQVDFHVADDRQNEVATTVATQVEAVADVRMSIATTTAKVPVGETFTYDIELENRGTKVAELVEVAVELAEGVQAVDTGGAKAELGARHIAFAPIAQLDPGQRRVLTVEARGSVVGKHAYRVEATSSDQSLPLSQEGATKFYVAAPPIANVQMEVHPREAKVAVGDPQVYEIHLENQSSQAAAGVDVVMHFGQELEPVAVAGAAAEIRDGTVRFAQLKQLEHGAPRTLKVTAIARQAGNPAYRAELTTTADTHLACTGSTGVFQTPEPQPPAAVASKPGTARR